MEGSHFKHGLIFCSLSSMKILIAPDKFKDALSAIEVCEAIEAGIKSYNSSIEVIKFPLADGGEGTAEILRYHAGGQSIELEVLDPLLRPIKAAYGLSADGKTAFIEMAKASGLALLSQEERNCLKTSSFGTGEMILDAINRGAQKIILGIGGSATTDGGIGMAAALGFICLDRKGDPLEPVGRELINIRHIEKDTLPFKLEDITVEVACDVNNPLYGPDGAAHVYGPQKGADMKAVALLDKGLQNLSEVWKTSNMGDFSKVPGAGAAGGMGAGSMAFLDAQLKSGIDLVLEQADFEGQLHDIDLIITGEGKIDDQTLFGKTIQGVCVRASRLNVPVAAFCGTLAASLETLDKLGLSFATSILNQPVELAKALQSTRENLTFSAYQFVKLFSMRTLD